MELQNLLTIETVVKELSNKLKTDKKNYFEKCLRSVVSVFSVVVMVI